MWMLERTRVKLAEVTRVDGCDDISVAILTNPDKSGSLNVVIEQAMAEQLKMRLNNEIDTKRYLPEALAVLFSMKNSKDYEVGIWGLIDGEYQATLISKKLQDGVRIRLSDAILMSVVANIPIFVDDDLLRQQLSPYTPNPEAVPLPINAISVKQLKAELEKALETEDYHLADQLQKELNKRSENTKK